MKELIDLNYILNLNEVEATSPSFCYIKIKYKEGWQTEFKDDSSFLFDENGTVILEKKKYIGVYSRNAIIYTDSDKTNYFMNENNEVVFFTKNSIECESFSYTNKAGKSCLLFKYKNSNKETERFEHVRPENEFPKKTSEQFNAKDLLVSDSDFTPVGDSYFYKKGTSIFLMNLNKIAQTKEAIERFTMELNEKKPSTNLLSPMEVRKLNFISCTFLPEVLRLEDLLLKKSQEQIDSILEKLTNKER